jgi:hypothetical protein
MMKLSQQKTGAQSLGKKYYFLIKFKLNLLSLNSQVKRQANIYKKNFIRHKILL